jgi:hypothetical protein
MGSAPATSARPPVFTNGKTSDETERTFIVYKSSLSIIVLRDQADAALGTAETLGVENRILADHQPFRYDDAVVDDNVAQLRGGRS